MHFSIPDHEEVQNGEGTFTVFRVHVNGSFHAGLRYSQLHAFHSQLKTEFTGLPEFPPKKFLSLSTQQLTNRRLGLETYLQTVSEIDGVQTNDLFRSFLRAAQHESSGQALKKVGLLVHLPNGQEGFSVQLWNNASTETVLQKTLDDLELDPKLRKHFKLFLFREKDGIWNASRKLENYECPYLSLLIAGQDHRIVLRKPNWKVEADAALIDDPVGLHLQYLQTVADIEAGWIHVPKESLKILASLQGLENKVEYVRHARQLKYYGMWKFPGCESSYPEPGTPVSVYIGRRELLFLTESKTREEIPFKIILMKCWRSTLHSGSENEGILRTEFSFEYLHGPNNLGSITVVSDQAILMSVSLQEIVMDMLAAKLEQVKSPPSLTKVEFNIRREHFYIRRDGSQELLTSFSDIDWTPSDDGSWGNGGSHPEPPGQNAPSASRRSSQSLDGSGSCSPLDSPGPSAKPSSTQSSSTSNGRGKRSLSFPRRPSSTFALPLLTSPSTPSSRRDGPFTENRAFSCIGDDDL